MMEGFRRGHLRTWMIGILVATTLVLVAILAFLHLFPSSNVVTGVVSGVIVLMVVKHLGLLALLLGSGRLVFPRLHAWFRRTFHRTCHAD
jgi:hypothetical protein